MSVSQPVSPEKNEMVDLSRMSESDRIAQFGVMGPDITGLVGYFRNQPEGLIGHEKNFMGSIARNGLELSWFCPVWDNLNGMSVLGVFVGTVTNLHKWQSDSSYVRFEADGVTRTFKSNHWAFVRIS